MIELLMDTVGFCVPAETNSPASHAVAAYVESYNAHDLDGVRARFTADARIGNGSREFTGEQLLANYQSIVFPRFPDVRIAVVEVLEAGDLVAQTETVTGIGEGESGLSVYRVRGGCIVEMSINK